MWIDKIFRIVAYISTLLVLVIRATIVWDNIDKRRRPRRPQIYENEN